MVSFVAEWQCYRPCRLHTLADFVSTCSSSRTCRRTSFCSTPAHDSPWQMFVSFCGTVDVRPGFLLEGGRLTGRALRSGPCSRRAHALFEPVAHPDSVGCEQSSKRPAEVETKSWTGKPEGVQVCAFGWARALTSPPRPCRSIRIRIRIYIHLQAAGVALRHRRARRRGAVQIRGWYTTACASSRRRGCSNGPKPAQGPARAARFWRRYLHRAGRRALRWEA